MYFCAVDSFFFVFSVKCKRCLTIVGSRWLREETIPRGAISFEFKGGWDEILRIFWTSCSKNDIFETSHRKIA